MDDRSHVAVAIKWADLRQDMDPLAATISSDARDRGLSRADAAAIEWALRLGESWRVPVVAVTAGPPEADAVLREATAVGAARLVRVPADHEAPSETVARALAAAVSDACVVCCGDYSADRGSGSVPAFLAHELDAAQGLGLTRLAPEAPGVLVAERRLDGGRRERLRITAPAVISVEPGTARLRRAGLPLVIAARRAAIEVLTAEVTAGPPAGVRELRTTPYRPRARVLPPPSDPEPRGRLLALSGSLAGRTAPRVVTADPDQAADELIGYLRANGYLPT
jgi:electron transfer flavoprotein beta subunit